MDGQLVLQLRCVDGAARRKPFSALMRIFSTTTSLSILDSLQFPHPVPEYRCTQIFLVHSQVEHFKRFLKLVNESNLETDFVGFITVLHTRSGIVVMMGYVQF